MTDNQTPPSDEQLPQVGWWCWRGDNHGHLATQPCRSDNVPIHVPAEWADEMGAVIQRIEDGDGEDDPAASAVVAVAVPPAGQTALRDRIAEVLARFGDVDQHAMADAVLAVLPPPATQTAEPVCVCGHPQLEAMAAAVWEQCGRSDSGSCVEDDPRNIAVAALGAVLGVLLAGSGDTATTRADVLRDFLWRLEQSAGDAAAEKFLDDNPELRRLADEAQQPVAAKHDGAELVRALHQPDANGECQGCNRSFDPCPTIAALDGTVEAQQQPETQDRSAGCCGRPPGAICVHDHPAAASAGVQTDEETEGPRTVCVCGHTKGEHIRLGGPFGQGRLLCDSCDPDSTENLVCKEFEAL